jgi:polyhydroxyalkanoate synthesis repressor PhaR
MVVIKKYSNRRLYDTSRSAYINLDELAELIRSGQQVKVVDAKTEEDLTRAVLTQALLELPGVLEVLPIALLHRIIRSTGATPMHPLVARQLGAGLELLETQLSAFEQQFGWPPPPKPPAPPPPPPEEEDDDEPSTDEPPPPDPEMDALRARLAEIEARLKRGR